jgi:hypothetical protein
MHVHERNAHVKMRGRDVTTCVVVETGENELVMRMEAYREFQGRCRSKMEQYRECQGGHG